MKIRHLMAFAAIAFAFTQLKTFAQGTAFTYQGRLNAFGTAANGSYDIQFSLFATNAGGVVLGGPVTNAAVNVTNGLFTTAVDFGPGVFLGTSNWLQLAVSTNAANAFFTLTPRQQVTPTPYAIYSASANNALTASSATTASSAASVPASGIGAGTANISISGNAATATTAAVAGLAATSTLATSAGTATTAGFATNAAFAGIATNALTFTNAVADAQLSANIARLNGTNTFTGTNTFNNVVIATNPANVIFGTFAGNGGGITNVNVSQLGGTLPQADLPAAVVTNNETGVTLGGTFSGTFSGTAFGSFSGSGSALNSLNASQLTGGVVSTSVLPNFQPSLYATIGGGYLNTDLNGYATVGGGSQNTGGGGYSTIGGGTLNTAAGPYSFIGGGYSNYIGNYGSVIGGGGYDGNIFGGNTNNGSASFIGGGIRNIVYSGSEEVIGGGNANEIFADVYFFGSATISGGENNVICSNAFYGVIGGGYQNDILTNSYECVIGGGYTNMIGTNSYQSVIAGGTGNILQSPQCVIGGGSGNTIQTNAFGSVISGGAGNTIQTNANFSTISGGDANNVKGNSQYSSILGGFANNITPNSPNSVIAGGYNNFVTSSNSFAAGTSAQAQNNNSFVWGDGSTPTMSLNNYSVTMRATNGFRFYAGTSSGTYAYLAPGSGSWTSMSDRNVKEHFENVDAQEVLSRVSALPISTWNYKTQPAAVRHIGPMAQDFKSAFAVGESDTGISVVDEGGVALAAIQGLNQKLEEQKAENAELKKQLEGLKVLVEQMAQKK